MAAAGKGAGERGGGEGRGRGAGEGRERGAGERGGGKGRGRAPGAGAALSSAWFRGGQPCIASHALLSPLFEGDSRASHRNDVCRPPLGIEEIGPAWFRGGVRAGLPRRFCDSFRSYAFVTPLGVTASVRLVSRGLARAPGPFFMAARRAARRAASRRTAPVITCNDP